MNILASECSCECESGWTLYLEHSFLNPDVSCGGTGYLCGDGGGSSFNDDRKEGMAKKDDDEREEEDLSMVSDASSGPPNFHGDDIYLNEGNVLFYPPSKSSNLAGAGKTMKKVKENQPLHEQQQLPSFIDDTASSPVFNLTMNNFGVTNVYQADSVEDLSQGFSATYYEESSQGRTTFQDHFNFLQPSLPRGGLQKNQWFGGKGNETI